MRPGHESNSLRVKMPVPDAILNEACYRYSNEKTKQYHTRLFCMVLVQEVSNE